MTGLSFTRTPENPRLRATGHDLLPATLGETLGATFADPTLSPTELILTEEQRMRGATDLERAARIPVDPITRTPTRPPGAPDPSRQLRPEELDKEFGGSGLTFDRPMRREEARILADLKREERIRQDILARGPGGVGATAAQFGTMFARAALDPVNVAAAFVPAVGPARYAALLSRFGKTGGRFSKGVVEGVIGNTLIEPVVLGLSARQQLDYGMTDALVNVALGGVLGGAAQAVGGKMGDFIRSRSPETRQAAVETSVAQMVQGRQVEVSPILREDLRSSTRIPDDPFLAAIDPSLRGSPLSTAPAREFNLGPFVNNRFAAYTPLGNQDRRFVEGVVTEVQEATPGHRVFIEREGQGQTRDVLGVKSTMPEFIQRANAQVEALRKRRKAIKKANLKLPISEKERALPAVPPILTRENVAQVGRKLLESRPLGKQEGDIAVEIVSEARAQREANVQDMLRFREGRQAEQEAELRAFAERETLVERDSAADVEAAERAAAEPIRDADVDTARTDMEEAEQIITDMRAQDALSEADLRSLSSLDEALDHAQAYGRAARAAAVCMSGKAS